MTPGEFIISMDKRYEQTLLLDFYGQLLTEKQRAICQMYLLEDWSLREISEELNISRQGVSDALHRGLELLEKMEKQLHMRERICNVSKEIERLEQQIKAGASEEECLMQLQKLKNEIQIRS